MKNFLSNMNVRFTTSLSTTKYVGLPSSQIMQILNCVYLLKEKYTENRFKGFQRNSYCLQSPLFIKEISCELITLTDKNIDYTLR